MKLNNRKGKIQFLMGLIKSKNNLTELYDNTQEIFIHNDTKPGKYRSKGKLAYISREQLDAY